MNILFLEKKLRTDKLGMLYLSAIMKKAGHYVDLLQTDLEDIDEYLSKNKVDFIMYSVMSGDHTWFLEKNKELKSKYSFKSVMGGPHFTFFSEIGAVDPDIDYLVVGPGENVILDIIEGRITTKLVMGHLPDVNNLPEPDRSILYKYPEFGDYRMKRFIAGRYCLYSCKYCFNHLFKKIYQDEKKSFFQRVSPERIIDEIKHVKEQYKLELVYFNDDDLAASKEWLTEFCDLFVKEIGLEFCGSIRADSVDYETLKMMYDAGCRFLNIALESANPETQKFLRRGFITNDQIREASRICKELGIKVRIQNMVGLPVEDPLQDALDTLKMNQELDCTDSVASIFQPFAKTDLWQYCIDNNYITETTETGTFYEHTKLNIKDADKIDRLHKWWFFAINNKLPMELVKILIELPMTDEQAAKIIALRLDISKGLLYGL
jgi:anaerobic magnesium-protoporphyrin IX monomethyl ester cyclase